MEGEDRGPAQEPVAFLSPCFSLSFFFLSLPYPPTAAPVPALSCRLHPPPHLFISSWKEQTVSSCCLSLPCVHLLPVPFANTTLVDLRCACLVALRCCGVCVCVCVFGGGGCTGCVARRPGSSCSPPCWAGKIAGEAVFFHAELFQALDRWAQAVAPSGDDQATGGDDQATIGDGQVPNDHGGAHGGGSSSSFFLVWFLSLSLSRLGTPPQHGQDESLKSQIAECLEAEGDEHSLSWVQSSMDSLQEVALKYMFDRRQRAADRRNPGSARKRKPPLMGVFSRLASERKKMLEVFISTLLCSCLLAFSFSFFFCHVVPS